MSATIPSLPTPSTEPVANAPQNQSGFNIPPAGQTPALPAAQPHQYPGQRPGFVPNPGQQQQQQATPQEQPQQVQPQQQGLDIAAILQAALTGQPQQTAPLAQDNKAAPQPLGPLKDYDVDKIDDPIIKSMASVLKVAGKDLDLDRVLGNALATGNPSFVDVAYIKEKGGAQAEQLIEIAKGIVQAVEAKSAAITAEVHAMVGGEAQWAQSTAVFNQSAPEELRIAVKTMLDSTNPAYIKAGAKIVAEFGRASGQLPKAGSGLLNGASAGSGFANGISASEFKTLHAKLNPNDPNFKEARDNLFARRAIGKRAGL